jgi:hypothetical protein
LASRAQGRAQERVQARVQAQVRVRAQVRAQVQAQVRAQARVQVRAQAPERCPFPLTETFVEAQWLLGCLLKAAHSVPTILRNLAVWWLRNQRGRTLTLCAE